MNLFLDKSHGNLFSLSYNDNYVKSMQGDFIMRYFIMFFTVKGTISLD